MQPLGELNSIELRFSFDIRIDLGVHKDDEDSYHREMSSDIVLVNIDEESGAETDQNIGYVEIYHIEGTRAYNNRLDIVYLCDMVHQDLYDYANALYVDGWIDEAICAAPRSNDSLVLHRIEIDKRFRGRGYGLTVMRNVSDRLGYNCGAILIKPAPLQFCDIGKKPSWQERYDTSAFSSDRKAATAKLREYWGNLGLRETNDKTIYCIPQE